MSLGGSAAYDAYQRVKERLTGLTVELDDLEVLVYCQFDYSGHCASTLF